MPAGYAGPPERLRLYEQVVDATPGAERKGATMPYTSRNGHMFSFLDPTGSMALRLPADAREEFLARHGAELAVQHGPDDEGVRHRPARVAGADGRAQGLARPQPRVGRNAEAEADDEALKVRVDQWRQYALGTDAKC